ncbi:MAG: response regulator [Acidobacteria bacterium]|nr:response regulator [Acidobacteriota bacterium]
MDLVENTQFNNRILLVDDNEDIHIDFRKVLEQTGDLGDERLDQLVQSLFDDVPHSKRHVIHFQIDSAYQGEEALEMVAEAEREEKPYAVVFMDVRMPPGLDGVQTIRRIWENYRFTEIVIVTAYSDYTWDKLVDELGLSDKLLCIKKPFDPMTVKQLAVNLTKKWNTAYQVRRYIQVFEKEIGEKARALDQLIENL